MIILALLFRFGKIETDENVWAYIKLKNLP